MRAAAASWSWPYRGFASSGAGEVGQRIATPVSARRQTGQPSEQPPKECGILVADLPGDVLDRLLAGFEQALGVLDPEVLNVVQRSQACGIPESTLQAPLGQPRVVRHLLDRPRDGAVVGQPRLQFENERIAVIAAAFEHHVGRDTVVVPLQGEEAGHAWAAALPTWRATR